MRYDTRIEADSDAASTAKSFCRDFQSAHASRRFVMGRGRYARSLAALIDVAGYVDDFNIRPGPDGTPVYASTELPSDALVVVASILRPHTAQARLNRAGIQSLDYFAFAEYCDLPVLPVSFWEEFRRDFYSNQESYQALRYRLADSYSKTLLDNIIRFRLLGEVSHMRDYSFNPDGQYFEPFLELSSQGETFLDVGGFDGQTTMAFADRYPGYERICVFEPSPVNVQSIRARLGQESSHRIDVYPYALGKFRGKARFDTNKGSASRIDDQGNTIVDVVALDDLNIAAATYMKLDIEGGEVSALEGGTKTISRLMPRLAVAVYHRFDDLWRIPQIVSRCGVNYSIYLRHYTEGTDETIMYFVPN